MLTELEIVNLAVIDHARIAFGPGLNVLTGETGAGKSIVMDALGLVLGGRSDAGMVRAGADGARVEAFFDLPGTAAAEPALAPLLDAGLAAPEDDTLILSREVTGGGRSVCRVNGRAVAARVVQEVGERLVDIHGQGASMSLLRVAEHVDLLDRAAGLVPLRARSDGLRASVRKVRRDLAELRGDERELARRADLLRHQIDEIARARLSAEEEDDLRADHRRQANAEELARLAAAAHEAVGGGSDDGRSARDLLGTAQSALADLERLDPAAGLAGPAQQAALVLADLADEVRAYRDGIQLDAGRLAEIEERLALIFSLKRKYGATLAEVLAFAEGAAAELESLAGREATIAAQALREAELAAQLAAAIAELGAGRRAAAAGLAGQVEEQLAALAMSGRFVVQVGDDDDAPVEFLLSLNPGEPPRPLARIASGGETSRVMLAIKAALAGTDPHPVLVFDEVDAGIGGRVGDVIGRRLWDLGRHSQVLAVTHLPQIAGYADVHLRVRKLVEEGRTLTRVDTLDDHEDRMDELSDMFGSDRDAGRLQARALLHQAARTKEDAG